MKKSLSKIKSNIRINKNLFIFLLVIVMVGLASGSLLVTILNSEDKVMVSEYLNNFLTNLNGNNLNYSGAFLNTLIFTIGVAILIWLLGISVIGFALILIFLFIKAFSLGFSVASIIVNFNFKGVLLALAYIIPHHVINMMVYILISSYALILSYKLISSFTKKKNFDFKNILNRYLFILLFSVVILFLSSLFEVYGTPILLKFVSSILN